MNDHYLRYLEREHARLDAEIREEELRPFPRQFLIGRLKKLKLAVKDQMAAWSATEADRKAA
ncbi:YdcH family protein [Novosphingobium sp. G106]|uniref:YdcH family protein n=1 Tax=Novosphingobium sp. G106 TaxID=2849500 RepID=UPI001C2DDAAC|nr:YdcH family protein [Novosphingobium sp. G106]MBV1688380.1 YdcH family protein [Novosphingobium sp. G106]